MSPTSNPILDCCVCLPFCEAAATTDEEATAADLPLVSETGVLSSAEESPSSPAVIEADAEFGAVFDADEAAAANSDGCRAISQPSKV